MISTGHLAKAEVGVPMREAVQALRNAVKLGSSLVLTWAVALGVRVLLPRYLGPEQFGPLSFSESFTTTTFVLLGLGLDVYIRKEVPVRRDHASEFFGGVSLLRLFLAGLLIAAAMGILAASGRPRLVQQMVLAFAAAQCFMVLNTSMAALLQAQGHVGGLSITSVAGKLLWGAGILICMILGFGLVAVPLTLLGSEILKSAALLSLTRKHLKLRFQFDLRATKTVIVKSLPFYLNTVAFTAYSTLGVSLLTFQVNRDEEVGWYGAATNLAGLALLMTPLIGWVLMPLYSKAAARSDQELTAALRRTLELVLTLAVPISLMLSVGADVWIPAMFGREFVPATLSLRLLAPMFVLTYMASVCGIGLIMLDRGWRVTLISLGSLVLNTLLNLVLIRPGLSLLGPGGGGAGCALAQILTEAAAAGAMVTSLGGRAFDRRSATTLCKSLAACGAVVLLDRLVGALGPARLALDLAAYLALATWMGAIPVRQILQLTRSALSRHEASALPS